MAACFEESIRSFLVIERYIPLVVLPCKIIFVLIPFLIVFHTILLRFINLGSKKSHNAKRAFAIVQRPF